MTKPTPRRRRWRIGELAEATGVTVRTLHHYEHTGLLSASERTDGGHRMTAIATLVLERAAAGEAHLASLMNVMGAIASAA
ncbi:MerR family DNA-binding transcriptional regulator [Bradyrhizobium sp. RDT10]